MAPASFAVASSPSGERVKVAGRSVHHQIWGTARPGQPTIWLENGWFGQLLGWGDLPELLCQDGSGQDGWCVRAYDRDNYGWSYGAGEDRSAAAAAAEFAELLAVLGETEPILIVAWSGGGLVARCFAAAWPERVAGLTLLDAIPPATDAPEEQPISQRYVAERSATVAALRRIADRAEAGQLREADIRDYIEPDTQACYRERYLRLLLESAAHWRTYAAEDRSAAEMVALKLSSEQARVRPLLASLPLIALIAVRPPLASISDPYQRALAAGWRVSQEAAASGNYRYVSAGHVIHRDAPETVLAAVRDIREAIRL